MGADLAQRRLAVVHHVNSAQEGLHGQPAAVHGAATGRQDMVGAGAVVAEADRRPGTDEDRTRVPHPSGDGSGIGGLDLQVLRGIRIDDGEAGIEVVDEHDSGLAPGQGPR